MNQKAFDACDIDRGAESMTPVTIPSSDIADFQFGEASLHVMLTASFSREKSVCCPLANVQDEPRRLGW